MTDHVEFDHRPFSVTVQRSVSRDHRHVISRDGTCCTVSSLDIPRNVLPAVFVNAFRRSSLSLSRWCLVPQRGAHTPFVWRLRDGRLVRLRVGVYMFAVDHSCRLWPERPFLSQTIQSIAGRRSSWKNGGSLSPHTEVPAIPPTFHRKLLFVVWQRRLGDTNIILEHDGLRRRVAVGSQGETAPWRRGGEAGDAVAINERDADNRLTSPDHLRRRLDTCWWRNCRQKQETKNQLRVATLRHQCRRRHRSLDVVEPKQ